MSGGFTVDPEEVGRAAGNLQGAGQALAGAVDQFQSQAAALADAFGDDDLGSVLGMIYEVASEAAFESFQDNADGLQEIGHTLREMAEHYAEVESASLESFQQVLGGLS
ncbi:WXG100 family type VII secretion target [Lentzea sp. NPDC059081]|uniref:WXG100 family type VII secretion target n=1 Tax=Lentzea sp. NPDC059081 TaxID=3346719 RepID=UPI0036B241C8